MLSKKTMCKLLSLAFIATLIAPSAKVSAKESSSVFKNTMPKVERQAWKGNVHKAKPLVVLMDYKDYNHTQLVDKDKAILDQRFYAKYKAEDFTPEHYKNIFFAPSTYKSADGKDYVSMRGYFAEESGGSFDFNGGVAGWYQADHEAKYYGASDPLYTNGGTDQNNAAKLALEAFQKVANDPSINLSDYDVEDPMDVDNDGNYFEPDGVIDTLIVIHPGIGENFTGGSLGEDAIWPFQGKFYEYAAANNSMPEVKDSKGNKIKACKFICMEQNLPPDLMLHEYGHYLGLPDLYAYRGSTPPVQYWSEHGGSYLGPFLGASPISYGAYGRNRLEQIGKDKGVDLNWTNNKTISLNELKQKGQTVTLDQEALNGTNPNLIKITLPNNETKFVNPPSGKNVFFSGKAVYDMRNSMDLKKPLDLTTAKGASISFKTLYDLAPNDDFASVQVREKGSNGKWTSVKGNITTTANPNDTTPDDPMDRNPGNGITGSSNGKWVDANFDLKDFLGKEIELRIFNWTFDMSKYPGIYIDDVNITVDNKIVISDGAEDKATTAFNLNDFVVTDGTNTGTHTYMLELRNHHNSHIDNALGGGLFRYLPAAKAPVYDLVHDPGLLVWYENGEYKEQETKDHLGYAMTGIVDADQNPIAATKTDGTKSSDVATYQMRDAAFGLREQTPFKFTNPNNGDVTEDTSLMMNPIFDDSKDYSSKDAKLEAGLILPNNGVMVFVTEENSNISSNKVHITTKNVKNPTYQDAKEIKHIKVKDNKVYITTDRKYSDTAYVSYLSPDGQTENKLKLSYNEDKKAYEGDISFAAGKGTWKINYIIISDSDKNTKAFYNIKANKVFGDDFGKGDLTFKN
ncbi:immune inhibitor A domain-containing protein [Clostridium aciditolerans]|uniref:Immune inhibitor A n=1 Tax=Clostridium aciditolerans TaxID=339861 RepID=A0A934M5I4_9CLOT|nr:immune inhibitor A domain-containing protein [Clostridium aciditolerans]MBI6872056.1 immune inhibitor A [Clostridium aciditolerans]